MFNKRRASTGVHMPKHSNQPVQTSSAAATAATTAFSKKADAGLSSAAAAAALRSHPSPTPRLGELQTKRLQRRLSNGSDVSRASAMTTGHIQGLTSPSRTSLSDRTLRRSPSPAGRRPLESPINVPPIPAIPANMVSSNARRQRAASFDVPARIVLPTRPNTGRPVDTRENKLDRLKQSTLAQSSSSSPTSPVAESPRDFARQQINFSRPMSPTNSPRLRTASSDSPRHVSGWYAGPVVHNNKARHNVESVRDVIQQQAPSVKQPPLLDTDRHSHKFKKLLDSTTGSIKKQETSWKPTVVNEESLEQSKWSLAAAIDSAAPSRATAGSAIDAQPASSQPQTEGFSSDHRMGPILQEQAQSQSFAETSASSLKAETPQVLVQPHTPELAPASFEPQLRQSNDTSLTVVNRSHSLSPRRSLQLDSASLDTVHHPLGRSASPVKSALRVRQPGLNRTVSNPAGSSARFADGGSPAGTNRKKSVRINLEVKPGEDAAGLGGSKYAPPTPVKPKPTFEEDMDGIMQPRPALPFFGSIRSQHRDYDGDGAKSPEASQSSSVLSESVRNSDSSFESPRQSLLAGKGLRREDVDSSKAAERPATSDSKASLTDAQHKVAKLADEAAQSPNIAKAAAIEHFSTHDSTSPASVVVPPATGAADEDDSDELESSDDDSVYEDAAEQLENYEFASLDQILEEPTPELVDLPNDYMDQKPLKAPLLRQESGDTLALERRLEEARLNSEEHAEAAPEPVPAPTQGGIRRFQSNPAPEQVLRNKGQAPDPTPVHLLRSRAEVEDEARRANEALAQPKPRNDAPKSLRSSKWSPMNSSQRQPQAFEADQYRRSTQMSPSAPAARRSSSAAQYSPSKPLLSRKDSDDSVSSFKRSRKGKKPQDGRYTMRQSMRSASVDRFDLAPRGRTERRPQSPPDSGQQYKMRPSMRNRSSDTTGSKNESAWKRLTSPARFTSKLRTNKGNEGKGGKPTFGRRFSGSFAGSVADSEDDLPRRNFVSRFADSDDEDVELPPRVEVPSTPVRGIPRSRLHDDDSTDLEDSDEERLPVPPPVPSAKDIEQAHQANEASQTTAPKPTTANIDGLASSKFAPTRPTHKRWSSFLGMGSNKHKLTQQSNASTPTLLNTPTQTDSPGKLRGKLRRKPRQAGGEDAVAWPLKDHSAPTNGHKASAPFMTRRESDKAFESGQRNTRAEEFELADLDKPEPGIDGANSVTPTNGAEAPIVPVPDRTDKDGKSRFGRFKRMMKMSKKQSGNEGVF